jgi:signal transduction histidine kinase
MKSTTIFLVQMPDAVRDVTQKAARKSFPGVKFITTHTISEAAQHTVAESRQLLVLHDPDETEVSLAAQATDAEDLPRWAVLILGRGKSDLVETVPLEECNAQALARVFRSVVLQHELLRENLQLRGDLKTMARRFTHDLLSPLSCIHITCELMKELSDEDTSLVKAQIGVIWNMATESCQLIERVSYVLNASMDPIPANMIPMEAVIGSVLRRLESEIQKADATVQCPASWPEVNGVAPWLEVIWRNLIINALKHSLPRAAIQLGWSRQDEALRFWVANPGAEVAADVQPQLFQRFDQLHARPAPGLGLSLVQRLVSLHGGHCGYERRNDDYSTFYFTLPV